MLDMPSVKILLVVGIVACILGLIFMLVNGKGVTIDSFTDLSEATNTFTLYYMNGCPHCETILPAYKDFVAKGQYKKTAIRMMEQGDPKAAADLEKYNITGFPTFIMVTPNGSHIPYNGDRTVPAMQAFIEQNAA